MTTQPTKRKTRIVCISDTHSANPNDGAFKLPAGDILIHAGDLTNQGSHSELKKTIDWIEKADFQCKIVVAGNHDITLDEAFYTNHGHHRHNRSHQSPAECRALIDSSPTITYLHHEHTTIRLPSGLRTTFKVFGSPFVPDRTVGNDWAFGISESKAAELWQAIPTDTDIVVAHTPPRGHCDQSPKWGAAGSEILRRELWRVRPLLAVCGHVHEGRGAEVVRWGDGVGEEEESVGWSDPGAGNGRMSLLDLTGRKGKALKEGKETCIVNAAVMARSWPGPKSYNKPIVVDVELPVWEEDSPCEASEKKDSINK